MIKTNMIVTVTRAQLNCLDYLTRGICDCQIGLSVTLYVVKCTTYTTDRSSGLLLVYIIALASVRRAAAPANLNNSLKSRQFVKDRFTFHDFQYRPNKNKLIDSSQK